MNKKRLLLYGLLLGLAISLFAGFYVYHEYLGEDPDHDPETLANPIINEKLRAVVTRKTVLKTGNAQNVVLDYTDLGNKKPASLTVNAYYNQHIQLGDTLTKDKGEKMVLVYQKGGHVATVPID